MFSVDDEARPILEKAEKLYLEKFKEDIPILDVIKKNNIDKQEAERILKVVQELDKPLPDYGDRIY